MPEADIRIERVTKRFGDFTAVDDLSLEIPEGEFFSLLGPSGCGKTTTLRMIGGFEEVTSGAIFLGDDDVTDLPPFKRATNTVFQNYALFPHLSVYENIAFGLRRRKTPANEVKHQVEFMLDLVELPGLRQSEAEPALGRPAAAHRAGARPREQPAGPPARRAAGRPRPQAAQADAGGAQAHPERDRHHLHLRDARSGRGHDDVGSHRRHAPREDRAARRSGGALRAAADRFRGGLPGRQQPARRGGSRARRYLRGPPPAGRHDAPRPIGHDERRDHGAAGRPAREAARARASTTTPPPRRTATQMSSRGRSSTRRTSASARSTSSRRRMATSSPCTPRTSRPAAPARSWPTASASASPGSHSTRS